MYSLTRCSSETSGGYLDGKSKWLVHFLGDRSDCDGDYGRASIGVERGIRGEDGVMCRDSADGVRLFVGAGGGRGSRMRLDFLFGAK